MVSLLWLLSLLLTTPSGSQNQNITTNINQNTDTSNLGYEYQLSNNT